MNLLSSMAIADKLNCLKRASLIAVTRHFCQHKRVYEYESQLMPPLEPKAELNEC